jgi:peroxiredoxin
MRKMALFMIPVSLVLFVLLSTGIACAVGSDQMAPDFTLEDLNGNKISLSDFEGKVLFLNFWATWCPPCRAEIPDFIEVYNKYKDQDIAILGISVDRISAKKVADFAKKNNMNYPVAMATGELFRNYPSPSAIPTTLVIDGMGKVRHKKVGMMSKQELIDLYNEFKR